MRYYAARIGNMWLGKYGWTKDFSRADIRKNLGQLKAAVTRNYRGSTNDAFALAMTAAGGEIVTFELTEVPEEAIPLIVTTDGEQDRNGDFSFNVTYEGKKEKKKGW
jgi:hypothetical protein